MKDPIMNQEREQIARIIEPELDAHLENMGLAKCRALVGLAYERADAILALRSGGEGWRLVPVVPTREMANAALVAMQGGASTFGDWRDIWGAMLAAAPSPSIHREG